MRKLIDGRYPQKENKKEKNLVFFKCSSNGKNNYMSNFERKKMLQTT